MTFSILVSALRRMARRADLPRVRGLLSAIQFGRVLVRERARSDRTGDRFCLLTFSPREGESGAELARPLANVLRERLRTTDEAGWLDQQRIGVMLPATSPRGAWLVAEDICKLLTISPPPSCRVYSYPAESSQLDESIPSNRRGMLGAGKSQSHVDWQDSLGAHRPVEPLESLFVRAMPAWKRTIDIFGSVFGLLLLSPLFLLIAALIKLISPGPIFFRQWRSGRGGRPFRMYKFRSMVTDAESRKDELMALNEQDGPAFKITGDPRITRLGRFLRDTSIDELPQLWNVLKGDMSLVGPRPLPCDETANCLDWQRRRLDVTPGLTCIWQVRGRSQVTFNEWVRMDVEYVQRRSLWCDVKILLATVPAVIARRGAK
jgi:lipopolysaccharide/colanic/teichoic acid biosynthesis glycosyltransferase